MRRRLCPVLLAAAGLSALAADLHATIPHLVGMDYSKVYYGHNGRDERLTDVFEPKVIQALLA